MKCDEMIVVEGAKDVKRNLDGNGSDLDV